MSERKLSFSDRAVRGAVYGGTGAHTAYRFPTRPGLVLYVGKPTLAGPSTRTFYFVVSRTVDGKERKLRRRLGAYPGLTLAKAAREVEVLRQEIEEGRDLLAEKAEQEVASLTFADLIADYLADQRSAAVKTVDEVERAFMKDVVPALGTRRPAEITDVDIERVVDVVYKRGRAAMARHLLVYIRACFNHAVRGSPQLRERYGLKHNPADTVGRGRRGKPGKYGRPPVDDRFLSDEEIVRFWEALEASKVDGRTRIILKLLLLTGQRPSEVRCTPVAELKLTGAESVWELPGSRTKNGEPHSVPLVSATVALFRDAVAANGSSPFVFPSDETSSGIVGQQTVRTTVRRLCAALNTRGPAFEAFSPKDFRTTVKTGLARLGVVREVRDAVQNHKPQGIGDRAYNFHAYAKEKREALQLWADHVTLLIG